MKLRQMATAVLRYGEKALLIEKPGGWQHDGPFMAPVGGHLEPDELRDPRAAVLREIREETGLAEHDLEDLTFRYVLQRLKGDELRIQYVYTARCRTDKVTSSDEGQLVWVDCREVPNRLVSAVLRSMWRHYLDHPGLTQPMAGTMTVCEEPRVIWTPLVDPDIF